MIYRKNGLPIWGVLVLLFVASTGSAFAFSFGPPEGLTGAPNEANCTQCHVGNALNDSDDALMLTIPETYQPNEVYTIVVNLSRAGQSRWGFEMTALDDNGARAGSFKVSDAANTQLKEKDSKQYIMHTSAGSAQGTNDENQWTVEWTAPDADIGPITFYAAGNAANGDFGITGDYIYTTSEESTPPVPTVAGVSLEIVGDAARSTIDAVAGVSYTLKVTNTGNMMDTITLEADAEVGIEGSVLGALSARSVELEAGASTEVTLKVTGDLFAKPGEYPIHVTATSKTDGTKTAEVATTTTIEVPVIAGVSLEIVGNKALSTMDAVAGVSYTLKVTNTGNMADTITLEADAEVGIGGSVLGDLNERSIELEAGASTEVTLKVSGDLLTKPGDYPIRVTATSKTDSTKTAEVPTTTTIEMPPPPPTPWDVNDDGTVNVQDLVLVANELGESGESLKGDVNGDGTVDIRDLVLVASHFGEDTE